MATPTEPREPTGRSPAILAGLLRAHGEALRRQAARNCSAGADAEDALQDACVEFLRSYAGEAGEHALRYLMLGQARRLGALAPHRRWRGGRAQRHRLPRRRAAPHLRPL